MEKKRILVLMHYMELGGAESALLGLLMAHDPNRARMDVFIYDHRGPLMQYIPTDKVCLLPEMSAYSFLERPIVTLIKKGQLGIAFGRIWGKYKTAKYAKNNVSCLPDATSFSYQQKGTLPFLPEIQPDVFYDLVISFQIPHYIAISKVRARTKLGWIHTDYSKIFLDKKVELEMWGAMDYIASISNDVGSQFSSVFPSLTKKLLSIENIISSRYILDRSNEYVPKEILAAENSINLLSIGRFCYAKRFDEVGTIMKLLLEEITSSSDNLNIHWYIIGYGDEDPIRKNIEDMGMSEYITILGIKDNPYPYIKACDIYVQPSRYEGKSITVREAQILGKPVVVSAYPTASSQIQHNIDGVILPMDIEGFADGLADFIKNRELRKAIADYVSQHQYGNESEIEKIYKLIDA